MTRKRAAMKKAAKAADGLVGSYLEATGYTVGKRQKPPGKVPKVPKMRGAHAFEACKDGALIIYATLPDGNGEPIRVEPHRVCAVLAACGDALAKKLSIR